MLQPIRLIWMNYLLRGMIHGKKADLLEIMVKNSKDMAVYL